MRNGEKIYNYSLSILLFIGVCILFLLATNASFSLVDDFNIRLMIADKGQFKLSWDIYNGWDGRALSPLYFYRDFLLSNLSAEMTTALTTLGLLVTALFVTKCLLNVIKAELPLKVILLMAAMITVLLWLGMRPHMSRSFYWITGSWYMHANMLLIIWCFCLAKDNVAVWLMVVLSLFITMSGVTIAASVLTLYAGVYIFRLKSFQWNKQLPVMIALLLGTVITVVAPGNFSRLAHQAPDFEINLASMPLGFMNVLIGYLVMSKWIILGALVFVLAFHEHLKTVDKKKIIFWALCFYAAALASIVPFVVMVTHARRYTAVSFQTLLFIALIFSFTIVMSMVKIPIILKRVTALVSVLYFIGIGIQQYRLGSIVKNQITQRYNYLESKRGTKEVLELKRLEFPDDLFVNRAYNEPSDSTFWINKNLSRYYQTGPVILQ
jgi:hypothetical protein